MVTAEYAAPAGVSASPEGVIRRTPWGGPPTLRGGRRVTLGEIGDVTALCTADFTPPQTIACDFSGVGMPPDGDYLLTVATGNGQSKSDE